MKENILLQPGEEIKPIQGYEGLYSITSFGRVWSHKRKVKWKTVYREYGCYFLNFRINSKGYLHVILYIEGKGVQYKIHRLVAQAFIPNPNNLPEVNHKDGNKLNCRDGNLEWCIDQDNQNHASVNKLRTCKKHSCFYGVTLDSNKYWKAFTRFENKKKHIGCYKTEIEAAQAYNNYIKGYNLNRPLNVL